MVIRVHKTSNYTVMSNYHLRDSTISLKAKGLLSQMLSLPEDWDYSIAGLCSINKEAKTAIEGALDELKDAGYLVVNKLMPNQTKSGRIEYEYNIFETPKQGVGFLGLENLGVENLGVENQPQINTKDKVQKKEVLKRLIFVEPTLDEVREYCESRHNNVNPESFYNYYSANGWRVGKNKMKDWKASVRYWETNQRKKSKETDFEEMARELAREMRI